MKNTKCKEIAKNETKRKLTEEQQLLVDEIMERNSPQAKVDEMVAAGLAKL